MLPPQAPPAHTQTVYQEAQQAFDRVVAVQGWLATEHAALPDLPERPTAETLSTFLADLDTYWDATPADPADGVSRRVALARRLAGAARDLAILAHQDGSIEENTRALVRTLTTTEGELPSNITVREALFNGVPYAGALLVQDANGGDRVRLFSLDRGWETFDDLASVHGELESRARYALVSSSDLPGIARQHLATVGIDPFVDSRPIVGAPFTVVVDRLIEARRDKLRQAWFEFGIAEQGDARALRLADTVSAILDDGDVFDAAGILATRQANLAQVLNEQRLSRVPTTVADDWLAARDSYLTTLYAEASRSGEAGLPAVKGLAEFTQDALRERLHRLGVDVDPADIDVDVQNRSAVADFFVGAPPMLGLTDLAYRNIGTDDPVTLRAVDSQGATLAALDDATLRRTVRELDIHTRYAAYLDAQLVEGEDATTRRTSATTQRRAQMRFLANEARLSNFLDDEPRSLLFHQRERGFRWIEAVLDAPVAAQRARVETHPVVASQITYRGVPVRDVLLIGVREPRSVGSVVLYTPHAPDGVSFREFANRAEAARDFFYAPRFREYLLDRLPVEHAVVRANGRREFAGDRLANWVLGSSSTTDRTFTAERFEERPIAGDVFATLYDTEVQLARHNARTLTTASADAQSRWKDEFDRKSFAATARVIRDIVTAPIQSAATGWRLYDSVKAGDATQGFVDFTHFYVASLWAAPGVHHLGRAALGRTVAGARFRAAGRLAQTGAPPPPAVAFDARYIAPGVRKIGRADHEGIFTIDGKAYIEQAGRMYGVRYDEGLHTWRLMKPHAAPTAWGPAIRRTAAEGWAFHRVGLRGGSGRGGAGGSGARRPDLFDDYVDELERAFPDAVERDLVATRMRAELNQHVSAKISDTQRTRWTEACMRARVRMMGRASRDGHALQSEAVDLSLRPLPAGLRRVPTGEVPATLYYYDRMPFRGSSFLRDILIPREGYSNIRADIRTRFVAGGLHAVRVTTHAPPTASPILKRAMAMENLPRTSTFSVEIDTRHLTRLAVNESRVPVEVLAPIGGPEGTYFLVPTHGGPLLHLPGGFSVQPRLP